MVKCRIWASESRQAKLRNAVTCDMCESSKETYAVADYLQQQYSQQYVCVAIHGTILVHNTQWYVHYPGPDFQNDRL